MLKSFENEMDLSDKYSPNQAYNKMFGNFKNNPKGLADNYFNSPDGILRFFYVSSLIFMELQQCIHYITIFILKH